MTCCPLTPASHGLLPPDPLFPWPTDPLTPASHGLLTPDPQIMRQFQSMTRSGEARDFNLIQVITVVR